VALGLYVSRYRALAADTARFAQVVLLRKHGERAGTRLAHPHAQIAAVPVVAPVVRRRLACQVDYFDTHRSCGTCDLLLRELAQKVAIRTVETSTGAVNVLAGSEFLVLEGTSAAVTRPATR